MPCGWAAARLAIGLALAVTGAACQSGGSARSAGPATTSATTTAGACVRNEQDTACLPVAPEGVRVDRTRPGFTAPTRITNPRFPVGGLTQVLQLGREGGEPLRVEVTRLPRGRTIDWGGRRVETVASQFVAYLDSRIREVAIDYFAQADDGSVWYFGEDVDNYEDGVVADHDGSWLAGRDGPPGMIMPADPRVGAVYRSENIPGLVFEQDTVRSDTAKVDGPRGPVQGAALVQELLMDGTVEEKVFAPGYGEFRAEAADELVTVALALPTDAAGGPPPADLAGLTGDARTVAAAAAANRWAAAAAGVGDLTAAWKRTAGSLPTLLAGQMDGALDLQLRHRPPAEVDLDRLDLWARRLLADAAARDRAAVAGDTATLQVLWDRTGHTTHPAAARVAGALAALRRAGDGRRLAAAAAAIPALRDALGQVEAGG
jgi:hypothetical protein